LAFLALWVGGRWRYRTLPPKIKIKKYFKIKKSPTPHSPLKSTPHLKYSPIKYPY